MDNYNNCTCLYSRCVNFLNVDMKPKEINQEDWDNLTPFQQLDLELLYSLIK